MRRSIGRGLGAALALVLAVMWVFPVYWMINSSFLSAATISSLKPTFVPFGGTFTNYRNVFTDSGFMAALRITSYNVCYTKLLRL